MLKNRGKGSMNETILLIEDNESIIMGLEYLLTEEQYTFLAAKTKKEAQDLLASRQVDLVLLDVSLPDGNGFDLCRKIKEHDIAPVIFLTAIMLTRYQCSKWLTEAVQTASLQTG